MFLKWGKSDQTVPIGNFRGNRRTSPFFSFSFFLFIIYNMISKGSYVFVTEFMFRASINLQMPYLHIEKTLNNHNLLILTIYNRSECKENNYELWFKPTLVLKNLSKIVIFQDAKTWCDGNWPKVSIRRQNAYFGSNFNLNWTYLIWQFLLM